jgi:DNA-binding YbaB/EbfC family protein
MPDFGALLAQAQQMQQQMIDAQESLADLLATGTSGGGLVSATVDGSGDLRALSISPQAYDPTDPDAWETVADLVVAAVRDAKSAAEEQATARMAEAAGGLGGALSGALGGGLTDDLGDQLGGMFGGALGDIFGGGSTTTSKLEPTPEGEQTAQIESSHEPDRDTDD